MRQIAEMNYSFSTLPKAVIFWPQRGKEIFFIITQVLLRLPINKQVESFKAFKGRLPAPSGKISKHLGPGISSLPPGGPEASVPLNADMKTFTSKKEGALYAPLLQPLRVCLLLFNESPDNAFIIDLGNLSLKQIHFLGEFCDRLLLFLHHLRQHRHDV